MANKANLANSVLFAPLSDSDTTLEVYTGDGSLFPAAPFYLTLSPKNKWSRKINSEIVLVTAVTDDVFTITRAQKDTTAKEFSYGDLVANGIYTEDLEDTKDTAVTEAVSAALQAMMPVGFVVTLGVSTNPATLYGFGTWTRIQGQVIVGLSSTDTEFDTLNETGGAKTHTLSEAQIPSHRHTITSVYDDGNYNIPSIPGNGQQSIPYDAGTIQRTQYTNYTGGGAAHNNLQPYIVKYVWERTA